MAFMSIREFDCVLCKQRFTLLYGDLMVHDDLMCDECLLELSQLDGEELSERVAERLEEVDSRHACGAGSSTEREEFRDRIVENLNRLKEHRPSIRELVEDRQMQRRLGSPAVKSPVHGTTSGETGPGAE